MGRKLIELDAELIEQLAGQGLSIRMIAQSLGISHQTLTNRMNDNLDILAAVKKGKAKDIQDVVNVLKATALKGNVTSMIFYLKNKAPEAWRDQHDINHSGGITINVGFDVNNHADTPHIEGRKQANEKQVN